MLASTKVDGYLAAKGSFVSNKLPKHFMQVQHKGLKF